MWTNLFIELIYAQEIPVRQLETKFRLLYFSVISLFCNGLVDTNTTGNRCEERWVPTVLWCQHSRSHIILSNRRRTRMCPRLFSESYNGALGKPMIEREFKTYSPKLIIICDRCRFYAVLMEKKVHWNVVNHMLVVTVEKYYRVHTETNNI